MGLSKNAQAALDLERRAKPVLSDQAANLASMAIGYFLEFVSKNYGDLYT